jgi:hypothetical protein
MTTANVPGAEAKAPAPGSPEYDAAMAATFRESQGAVDEGLLARFEGKTGDEQVAAPAAEPKVRPENIPEKFWDAETGQVRVDDLLKSYTELETKGSKPAEAQAETPPAEAAAAVEAAGLNWDSLGDKINTKGELDASDYEALAKVGVPKEVAERYIELVQGERAAATRAAYDYAGGEQAAAELLDWAAKSLKPEQIAGYNQMLASPNWQVALDTLKTLKGRTSPTAGEPNLTHTPGVGGSPGQTGYRTQDDMQADMANPLYFQMTPQGAAYRATVQEKVRLAAYRR